MADARQNILNILEEKGIINIFKANLRAEVVKAMNKNLEKPEVLNALSSNEAQTCLELIYDFLEYAKLTNTLEIFTHECNMKKRPTKNDLEYKTGTRAEAGRPVLFSMLEKSKLGHSSSPDQSFEYPKSKFPSKLPMKVPEIGLGVKKEEAKKMEPAKVIEKIQEKPQSVLTSLPKPVDKGANMKLQPLTSLKKATNFKGFDVLVDEGKPAKRDLEEESIDEEIEEELGDDFNKEFFESQGTSSMGVDASVNSLALEDFDHVENVRAPRRK